MWVFIKKEGFFLVNKIKVVIVKVYRLLLLLIIFRCICLFGVYFIFFNFVVWGIRVFFLWVYLVVIFVIVFFILLKLINIGNLLEVCRIILFGEILWWIIFKLWIYFKIGNNWSKKFIIFIFLKNLFWSLWFFNKVW